MRTDLKPLKRTGLCEVFLVFHRRAAVTIGPPIQTVKRKLLSNLMRRVPKAPLKKNQTNQKQQPVRRIEDCNSIKKLKCQLCSKEISKAKANKKQAIQAQPAERIFNQQLTDTIRNSKT